MFYCCAITMIGIAIVTPISWVMAEAKERRDPFRARSGVKRNGIYYVLRVLKILFNPFVRGYYAPAVGFCVIIIIYSVVVCVMLQFTSNHNLIAFMLLPLSFGLNKLSERISGKILDWKGEDPDKLTVADRGVLIISVILIGFWFLTVVLDVRFPEYWDWMYENLDCMKMWGNTEYYKSLY